MTYTPPPLTGSPNLVKSQRLDVAIDGAPGSYIYNECIGMKSFSEGNSYSSQDVATFNTGVRAAADMPTQFKKAFSGTLQEYVVSDPVHSLLKAAGDTLQLVAIRVYDRSGNGEAHEGTAFVQWEPQGGSGEAVKTNNFTLALQDWNPIANPVAGQNVVPTITAATPPSQGLDEYVELTGTGFDTLTALTLDGTAVAPSRRFYLSPTKLLVKLPAGTAGAKNFVAKNPIGDSTAFSYTRVV